MANEKDDEFLSVENVEDVDGMDIYSLTKFIQNRADNELITTNQAKSADQVLSDITYGIKAKHFVGLEDLELIGLALIANRANIQKTAKQFKLDATELRILIRTEPILNAYWKHAYLEVKALVDDKVIDLLEKGDEKDKDILKEVFKKMYAGRAKGGYNINEMGLLGYDDPVASAQQEHIQKDIDEGDVSKQTVIIEFKTKTVTLDDDNTVEGQLLESINLDELDEDES